jgi:hypothetical protein
VLIGFDLMFDLREKAFGGVKNDHHIDRIEVMEDNGYLTVSFNDKNGDDGFDYTIDYAYVPRVWFAATGIAGYDNVRGGNAALTSPGESIMCGFRFDFVKGDHHLNKISVLTHNGFLQVDYADKNGDDRYNWRVKWAVLKP